MYRITVEEYPDVGEPVEVYQQVVDALDVVEVVKVVNGLTVPAGNGAPIEVQLVAPTSNVAPS